MPVENEEDVKQFQTIGLSEQKAKETLKNANVTKNLKLAISEVFAGKSRSGRNEC